MSTTHPDPVRHPAARNGHVPDTATLSADESAILVQSVARAARLGLVLRTLLFGGAVLSTLLALLYTWRRGDEMVGAILSRDPATSLLAERLLTLTLPVLLLICIGAVCVIGAAVLQSRALDERERALDSISRVRRETEGGASRIRTLARLAEDDLTQSRREYAMQLAFGRAAIVLTTGMVVCSITYSLAVGDVDRYTLAFGGGAVVPWLLAVILDVPRRTACNLSALSQRHLIVTAFAREVGIIEHHAYRAGGSDAVTSAQAVDEAVNQAVERIDRHCKGERDR